MRRHLLVTMALAGLIAVSAAGVAMAGGNKEEVQVEDLIFEAGGGFAPKKLPKKALAPIALTAEGRVKTSDGSHPPALKEARLRNRQERRDRRQGVSGLQVEQAAVDRHDSREGGLQAGADR